MTFMRHHVPAIALSAVLCASLAWPAAAQRQASNAGQPSLLGQFGDWGAYAGTSGGNKVCFALATPESSQTNPPNRPRDPVYLFVSTRPADNVRDEVSFMMGYPLRPGGDVTAEVDGTKFEMQASGDGAWVKNAAEEGRIVDLMRRGSELVMHGISTRGTTTTDRYSLKGVTQALDRVAQECR